MNLPLLVLWGIVGICPPYPPWPRPKPDPDPDPWPLPYAAKFVGIIGGIAGGLIFSQIWQTAAGGVIIDGYDALYAAASCVGAYAGSVLLGNIYEIFSGRKMSK